MFVFLELGVIWLADILLLSVLLTGVFASRTLCWLGVGGPYRDEANWSMFLLTLWWPSDGTEGIDGELSGYSFSSNGLACPDSARRLKCGVSSVFVPLLSPFRTLESPLNYRPLYCELEVILEFSQPGKLMTWEAPCPSKFGGRIWSFEN